MLEVALAGLLQDTVAVKLHGGPKEKHPVAMARQAAAAAAVAVAVIVEEALTIGAGLRNPPHNRNCRLNPLWNIGSSRKRQESIYSGHVKVHLMFLS